MNGKERIKKILNHKLPDRIGIFDFFDEITLINWEKQAHLVDIDPVEYFDFDLDFKVDNPDKNKFVLIRLDGPFQQLVSRKGLQQSLIDFAREPRHTKDFFKSSLNNAFSKYKKLKEEGHTFDAIWIYEDIAYDNGLYFSIDKYKSQLLDFHKEISSYFQNEAVFVIFHCDGMIEQLMPFLIKAGFSGIHPLQESNNPNIIRIKKDFKEAITFIGGIGLGRLKGLHQDILDRVEAFKQDGNYIFCFDGPIPQDTEFNIYEKLLAEIEAFGVYPPSPK